MVRTGRVPLALAEYPDCAEYAILSYILHSLDYARY
jgi:hypothetical protein